MTEWHQEIAFYSNGKEVSPQSGPSDRHYFLRGLTSDSQGNDTWLIGTKAEFDQYWKDKKVWFEIELYK
jgi:hypothetical protein